MNRDDIQKLLGGYATGTLTPEERSALFEAALTDQELFDALAREEALRDVLSDPAARAHLLAALDEGPDERPAPWYRAWWRPMVVMAAALVVVVGVAVLERSREPKPLLTAQAELPKFAPPVETPKTAPVLPPPPELKPATRGMKPLPLPPAATPAASEPSLPVFAAPAAAPPPPPPPALQGQGGAVGGAALPRQQFAPSQQQQQMPSEQQTQAPAKAQLDSIIGDRFASLPTVSVSGNVTDASGASVPSADISVKSLATGTTVNTTSDRLGQFSAPVARGSTYEISVSKPGFLATQLRDIAPLDGNPPAAKITLQIAAATETVEVTASNASVAEARAVSPRSGLSGALPTAMKAKAAAPPRAIAYQLLRAVPGSDPVAVPAEGTVPAGSSLTLRITTAADGYLRIVEGSRTIASPKVRRGVASDTPLPLFENPGRVELQVFVSPHAAESKQQQPSLTIGFNVQ